MSPHPLRTRLTETYGIEHPVVAAGMAFVGTAPGLAIAVCRAGGIGSLAIGPLPPEAARSLIPASGSGSRWARWRRPGWPRRTEWTC